jgi:hypothetical protein
MIDLGHAFSAGYGCSRHPIAEHGLVHHLSRRPPLSWLIHRAAEIYFVITKVGQNKGGRIRLHSRTIRVETGRAITSMDDTVTIPAKDWQRKSYEIHEDRAVILARSD